MKEQFVPYEIAIQLKEKGFDEPCFGTYNSFGDFILSNSEYPLEKNSDKLYDDIWLKHIQKDYPEHTPDMLCTAPLWQQVIDWFEDKFNLKFSIAYWNGYNGFLSKEMQYKYEVYIIPENAPSITVRGDKGSSYFDTRKDAITAAILKALTLI